MPEVVIVASFVSTIPALALISSLTIVPSTILALAIVTLVGSAPVPSLAGLIAAAALMSASTITPEAIPTVILAPADKSLETLPITSPVIENVLALDS